MNLSVIAVSGPQGVPGNGANLSGQYPIEIANNVVSINSGGYTSPDQLVATSGVIVGQIQAANAGVSSLNGLSGFVYLGGDGIGVGISGSTILLSGVSQASLAATGQQAIAYANSVGANLSGTVIGGDVNLSGVIAQTGQLLYALITGQSGQLNFDYATKVQVTLTGQTLSDAIVGGDINLSGVVVVTGQILDGRISSLSGYVVASDSALDQRITQTGGTAIGYVNSVGSILSGTVASTGSLLYVMSTGLSGALVASLAQTGQQSIAYATSSDINLSGNLAQTGIQLGAQIVAASVVSSGNVAQTGAAAISFTLGASGALQSQIGAGNGTQVRVTGSSTLSIADLTGIGGAFVFSSGGQVFISGSQGGAGGVPSVNGITSAVTVVGTGGLTVSVQGANVLVSGDPSISGALTQTGVALGTQIGALSGYVNQASGSLEARIAQTGGAAVVYSNGVGANLSGDLTQTGVALAAQDLLVSGWLTTGIAQTGAASVTHANGVGVNLSGSLTQTGSVLDIRITSLSGYVQGASGALQAQITAGAGTQVKVTGSTTLGIADLTGIGGVIVLSSGGQVFISGVAGGGGVPSINGITSATTIAGTGGLSVITQGSIILVSGDQSISGVLTQTGVALGSKIDALSGFVGQASGGLESRIAQTGAASLLYANGIGQSLSGNLAQTGSSLYVTLTGLSGQGVSDYATKTQLTTTGQTLDNKVNALSGFVGQVSGGLEVRMAQTGAASLVYANGIGSNLSGNLTQTGVTLGAKVDVLSGFVGQVSGGLEARIALTGGAALAYVNGMGSILSGNLSQTGATLGAKVDSVSGFVTLASGGLEARIAQSGVAGMSYANGIGASLSGNLTLTGQTLQARITSLSGFTLDASGALQAQISAGGSQVRVSGSASIAIADFSGIGGVAVVYSGSQILVSGSAGGPGGGVPSVNGITDAVTIAGTGGLVVTTAGQSVLVSGFNAVAHKQILFSYTGQITGEANLTWDHDSDSLNIGSPTILPNNPLAIAGNVNSYLQVNSQNRSNGANAATEYVVTNDVGSDLSGYMAVGINGSNYAEAAYAVTTSGDGYVFVNGGNLSMGTATQDKFVEFHTEGTLTGNTRVIISRSGINVINSGEYLLNGRSIVQPMIINFTAGSVTATNMPAALSFFANSSAYITYADLSRFTGVALYINKAGTAGAAASQLFLRYRDAFNTTATNWTQDITSPVMQFPVNVTNTLITSGFRPLVAGAKSGVYLALMGTGGDGVLDPVFGLITAQFM